MQLRCWGLSGNPGGDLLGEGDVLDDGLGEGCEGVDCGVAAAAVLDLDGVEVADDAAGDSAPDEVQLSSLPWS